MLIGVLGVVTGAHLAAVFLAGDSRRAGLPDLVRAFRARALASGALAGRRSRSAACSCCAPTPATSTTG